MNHTAIALLLCSFLAQDAPPADPDPGPTIFPRFQRIGPEDGMTAARISSLLQDRQGKAAWNILCFGKTLGL